MLKNIKIHKLIFSLIKCSQMSSPYIMFCLDQTLVNLYRPHIPLNLTCSQTLQELNEQSLQTHTHTYTHRHDSAIKMNEILLSAKK